MMKASVNNVISEEELRVQYDTFVSKEPEISGIISAIAGDLGLQMAGWQFRVKTWKSAREKVMTRKEEKDIASMKDVLRYTFLVPEESFGVSVNDALDKMASCGMHVQKLKNYWTSASDAYNGINAQVVVNGTTIEVQFHTDDSLRVKEELNHPLYERARVLEEGELKDQLKCEMMRIWETQRRPKDFEQIRNVNWTPKEFV